MKKVDSGYERKLLIVAYLLIAGCASQEPTNQDDWYEKMESTRQLVNKRLAAQETAKAATHSAPALVRVVDVEVDEFTKETTYRGPMTRTEESSPVAANITTQLYATQAGSAIHYSLLLDIRHTGHSFMELRTALDTDSKKLSLSPGRQFLNGCTTNHCTYTENATVHMTRDYLEDHLATGMRIRVQGAGQQIVNVAPQDIALFLKSVPAR